VLSGCLFGRAQHPSFGLVSDFQKESGVRLIWLSECQSPVSYRPILVFVAHACATCSKCLLFRAEPQPKAVVKLDASRFACVLEGDNLAAIGQGIESSNGRDQSVAMMQPEWACVGAATLIYNAMHASGALRPALTWLLLAHAPRQQ
jgi:hypothetical protein